MPALVIDPRDFHPRHLDPAVAWIARGGLVAFPTDTFYGLAADPRNAAAVDAVFAVKGRAARAALPLVGASRDQIERMAGALTGSAGRLARAFWPGPLSLVIDAPSVVAAAVHGGTGSVAVRVPAHPLACALAAACGHLLTATSANYAGAPPAARPADLGPLAADARVFVIDAGTTPGGVPSTIVDVRGAHPTLLREGAVAWKRVLESLQE